MEIEIILFSDQSSDTTGWSIFKEGKLIKYGYFKLSDEIPKKDVYAHTQRRILLEQKILNLVEEYKVTKIVYEGVFQSPNVSTHSKLSKVQGQIECLAEKQHLQYEEFIATSWRSYLPLKFSSKKPKREEIKQAVKEYVWSVYPETKNELEDTLEAIAMGISWHKKYSKDIT